MLRNDLLNDIQSTRKFTLKGPDLEWKAKMYTAHKCMRIFSDISSVADLRRLWALPYLLMQQYAKSTAYS